ncbi:MAG: hypothetical protein VB135_00360 [Burkholderia sp.]
MTQASESTLLVPVSVSVSEHASSVEEDVRSILMGRKKYGTSGQRGEDLDLIREALEHRARSTSPNSRGAA